jgi:HSP20 family protein
MIPIRFGQEFPATFSPILREFERFFGELDQYGLGTATHTLPELVTHQDQDAYRVEVDVPGLTEKDVNLDLHRGVLTISGERSMSEPEEFKVTHRERGALRFSRSLRLPEQIDEEKVKATVKDGVLTVELPKREEVKPRRIPITTN